MKQCHAILDEESILGVGQMFRGCILQEVVQERGFIGLREKNILCPKARGYRHQAVLHQFFQVQWLILTLRLDEELECNVALLLILDNLELKMFNKLIWCLT